MGNSAVSTRLLLRQLRAIMAKPADADERFSQIAERVASDFVAEVCSIYLLRADGKLELFATVGLRHSAVHQTLLNLDEGLVGAVASHGGALNLADAPSHPAFSYRPETGEEKYHGFLGVPISRAGRTLGVLVVQNVSQRTYTDEDVEALRTAAMVIAEAIAAGEIEALGQAGVPLDFSRPVHLPGAALTEGIGLGTVWLHEPRIVVTDLTVGDERHELTRLAEAIEALRLSLDELLSKRDLTRSGEPHDILEAYRMFAHDQGWVRRIEEAIRAGLTAEAAVETIQSQMHDKLMRQSDLYLQERRHDFDDLSQRLIRHLMGRQHGPEPSLLPKDAVIVAQNMAAAQLLEYGHVRGLVLEEGTSTSHIAIVARALGIAAVGQIDNIVAQAETGDPIIVDADSGHVHLRPPKDIHKVFSEKVRYHTKQRVRYAKLKDLPTRTPDGISVSLQVNAGLMADLSAFKELGADGIGLFRTELHFLVASEMPRAQRQSQFYKEILNAAGDRPVTFRTLDIGSDKILPYLKTGKEENPAMGWRAIRMGVDRPGILRMQIRALLKAGAGKNLKIMFPMISHMDEFETARQFVERESRYLDRLGKTLPAKTELGVMIEVPSLLYQLDGLFDRVDFASVGTNDLFQFFYAIDRTNAQVNDRFDLLDINFLHVLRQISEMARRKQVPLTSCGEMSGHPLPAMVLVALGYRGLSMDASRLGPIKSLLLEHPIKELADGINDILNRRRSNQFLKNYLRKFAMERNIPS